MAWTFHVGDLDSDDVLALLAFHFESMQAHSPPGSCHVLPIDHLRRPEISMWSVREGGVLLGVGALKQLSAGHGEIKSMRTAPHALGRGVGTALLHHIIEEARQRRYRRLSLETGSGDPFAVAIRLYEREGFLPSGPFGNYRPSPFTRFLTREL